MTGLLDMLCPSEYVQSVTHIDVAGLKARRINTMLVDLDNTLVPWRAYDIPPGIGEWIKQAMGQGMRLCIVSNTRTPRRLHDLAAELGVPYVRRSLKPRRGGFLTALKLLGEDPARAAVIGDQVFTDILGGNRLHLYTILVCPLHPREFAGTKITRFFERQVLRLLERRGMLHRPSATSHASGEQTTVTSRQMKAE